MNATKTDDIARVYWLACRAAAHVCAMPVTSVVETMRPLPVEAFPRAPAFVSGLAIIRSQPVPVIDMRSLIGEASSQPGRFVTIKAGDRIAALAFDTVLGVHGLRHEQVIDLPPLLGTIAGDAIKQVSAKDEALFLFLETGVIFPPGLIDILDAERAKR